MVSGWKVVVREGYYQCRIVKSQELLHQSIDYSYQIITRGRGEMGSKF